MISEIELRKNYLKKKTLESIYFGGGTPSILSEEDLINLFNKINSTFKVPESVEITLEGNPEDLSVKKLKFYKEIGINRLSIGIQSFKDEDLIFMNRAHNSRQAKKCVIDAKKVGFNNISVDLIYSLPNQKLHDWEENLKETFKLGIQHISAYSLTIEEKTNLNYLITTRKISELEDVASSNHFNILVDKCQKKGFIQYEISNFSKKGFISRHNSAYWLGKEYLGIGPSAHSYNGKSRSWNISSNKNYIESIQKGVLPFEKEDLSQDEIYNDYIMTSLRTIWGVDLDFIKQSFGQKYYTHLNQETQKWLHNGQIILESGKIYLSMKGKYISDNICADLFITD